MKTIKTIIIIFILLMSINNVSAFASFVNGGFETGDCTGWGGYCNIMSGDPYTTDGTYINLLTTTGNNLTQTINTDGIGNFSFKTKYFTNGETIEIYIDDGLIKSITGTSDTITTYNTSISSYTGNIEIKIHVVSTDSFCIDSFTTYGADTLPVTTETPINLQYTSSIDYINYTWGAGVGNITDSFYVCLNDVWDNGTTNNFKNSFVGCGNYSNISVYAYNTSGGVSGGFMSGSHIAPCTTPTPTPTPYNDVINFTPVTDLINGIIPLFTSLLNLFLAVMPLLIIVTVFGGVFVLVIKFCDITFDFNMVMGKK